MAIRKGERNLDSAYVLRIQSIYYGLSYNSVYICACVHGSLPFLLANRAATTQNLSPFLLQQRRKKRDKQKRCVARSAPFSFFLSWWLVSRHGIVQASLQAKDWQAWGGNRDSVCLDTGWNGASRPAEMEKPSLGKDSGEDGGVERVSQVRREVLQWALASGLRLDDKA